MSKQVTYKCDLCKKTKPPNELYSMYWDSTADAGNGKFGAYKVVGGVDNCDKHICTDCISAVKKVKTATD